MSDYNQELFDVIEKIELEAAKQVREISLASDIFNKVSRLVKVWMK